MKSYSNTMRRRSNSRINPFLLVFLLSIIHDVVIVGVVAGSSSSTVLSIKSSIPGSSSSSSSSSSRSNNNHHRHTNNKTKQQQLQQTNIRTWWQRLTTPFFDDKQRKRRNNKKQNIIHDSLKNRKTQSVLSFHDEIQQQQQKYVALSSSSSSSSLLPSVTTAGIWEIDKEVEEEKENDENEMTKRYHNNNNYNNLHTTSCSNNDVYNEINNDNFDADSIESLLDVDVVPASLRTLRAGASSNTGNITPPPNPLDQLATIFSVSGEVTKVILETITTIGMIVIPPMTFFITRLVALYRILPQDAIIAQAGLIYCFAGGYFPTLFAAISAANQSGGLSIMGRAIQDISDETNKAIQALIMNDNEYTNNNSNNNNELSSSIPWGTFSSSTLSSSMIFTKKYEDLTPRERFGRKTRIVLGAIDPLKINMALGALYTTWLSISIVLERQFAKTIALSITIADYLNPTLSFLLQPPFQLIIPKDLHQWVPLLVQWICKAMAMSFAWKLQRILTASTSAVAGGLMFSRSLLRMIFRKNMNKNNYEGKHWYQKKKRRSNPRNTYSDDATMKEEENSSTSTSSSFNERVSPLDEGLGLLVAALGLYAQIGNGFSFRLPFPLNLLLWPFTFAENWIQWQITKKPKQ